MQLLHIFNTRTIERASRALRFQLRLSHLAHQAKSSTTQWAHSDFEATEVASSGAICGSTRVLVRGEVLGKAEGAQFQISVMGIGIALELDVGIVIFECPKCQLG